MRGRYLMQEVGRDAPLARRVATAVRSVITEAKGGSLSARRLELQKHYVPPILTVKFRVGKRLGLS